MTGHGAYYNGVLQAMYCRECGEPWDPCLFVREEAEEQRGKPWCRCSHSVVIHNNDGTGRCTSLSCGCIRFRVREVSE